MKRMILSLLLILVQNGFAMSDEEYNQQINKASTKIWKQTWRCVKALKNHPTTSNPQVCLKVFHLLNNSTYHDKSLLKEDFLLKAGVIFYKQNNYIKAYEYWFKSAKLNNIDAQRNLDILCKEHSWACK